MKSQVFEGLLRDLVLFSKIQEKLLHSIENRDEETVLALNLEGRNLLDRLPSQLADLKNVVSDLNLRRAVTFQDVQSLVQWVEKSQSRIFGNEVELGKWKDALEGTLWKGSVERAIGPKPEHRNFVEDESAEKPNLNSSKFSSHGIGLGKPVWGSQAPQEKIGEKFDRLT